MTKPKPKPNKFPSVIHVRATPDLLGRVKRKARELRCTESQLIRDALYYATDERRLR